MRLVRLLLCLLFILCVTALARAGDIVIVTQAVQNWQGTVAPLLYVTYDTPFTSSDNVAVLAQPGVYQKVQCSLNTTTHVLTIPQFTIKSTEDGKDDRTSTVSFTFYNPNGSKIGPFGGYAGLRVPAAIVASVACSPTGGCATFSDLAIYNAGSPHLPETTYYDARTVDQKLAAITGMVSGIHDPGSNGLLSRTALNTVAPRSLGFVSPVSISNPDGVAGAPTISLTYTPENVANKNASGGYAGLSGGKLTLGQGQQVWALTDLTDVTAKKGTSTIVQMQTGATNTDDCAKFDVNGNIVSAGAACGTGGGGVASLNSLTGAVSLAGTSNQVIVTPAGSTITLTTPQDIHTGATPRFARIGLGVAADANNTFTITGPSSLNRSLNIVQSPVGSGTDTAFNQITINDTADVGGAFTEGFRVTHNFGGGATKGGREAIYAEALLNSPTNAGNINHNYVGGVFVGQANSADGGTNTGAGALGAVFGINPIGVAVSGATNLLEVTGGEVDIAMRLGSSANIKYGLSIAQMFDDKVQGAGVDAALGFSNQSGSVGWNDGILFTNANGVFPIKNTGKLFRAIAGTVDTAIDLSALTITSNAFISPKFRVTGAGVPSINNATIDAWDSSYNPMYLNRDFSVASQSGANPSLQISGNAYQASGNWTYIESGATYAGAANFQINQNTFLFRVAPAANAGDPITWSTALALDGSGNGTLLGSFSAGAAKFTVNATGNITKINNVTSSWPGSQGAAGTFLQNDGAGNYSWVALTGSGTVTSFNFLNANGITGSVTSPTTAPVLSLSLGAITPTSVQTPLVLGGSAVGSSLELKSTSGVGTTDFIKLTVGNNGGTEALRVVDSGRVGIGTTTPGTYLHVKGQNITGRGQLSLEATDQVQFTLYNGATLVSNYYHDIGTNLTVAGTASAGGQFWLVAGANVPLLKLDQSGGVLPGADSTYNLGNSSNKWALIGSVDLYASDGLIVKDSDGAGCHKIRVNTAGTISASIVTCP